MADQRRQEITRTEIELEFPHRRQILREQGHHGYRVYFSFRCSMLNYQASRHHIFNNSRFEYSLDLDRRTFSSVRHYFFIDKKWPIENWRLVFSIAAGFVW